MQSPAITGALRQFMFQCLARWSFTRIEENVLWVLIGEQDPGWGVLNRNFGGSVHRSRIFVMYTTAITS